MTRNNYWSARFSCHAKYGTFSSMHALTPWLKFNSSVQCTKLCCSPLPFFNDFFPIFRKPGCAELAASAGSCQQSVEWSGLKFSMHQSTLGAYIPVITVNETLTFLNICLYWKLNRCICNSGWLRQSQGQDYLDENSEFVSLDSSENLN